MKKYRVETTEQREYMNVHELAELLDINQNAAYNLCKRPGFPAVRVSPRRIVIPRAALHQWMVSNPGM